ncbi:hypothetical protein LTR10_000463 [Elasticomyces elasticus]|nr:hypothetical protein LTR10_000463 [Elasticomyces elasticus]KAK4980287.1 hypothetical protein LTR42_000594 [Elasticomyces elasticus]
MSGDQNLELLRQATTVLKEIASFYVSNHLEAIRARKKVERRCRARPGQQAFHATLLSRLTTLHITLQSNQDAFDLTGLEPPDALSKTLQTVEELVDDTNDGQVGDYPGVHNLIEEHGRDKVALGPRPLGYRLCLFCPSLQFQDRLKYQIALCHDALIGAARDRKAKAGVSAACILSDIEDIQEWHPLSNVTGAAERLHGVLERHLRCAAGHQHNHALVSSLPALHVERGKTYYHLCLRAEHEDDWRSANLELMKQEDKPVISMTKSTRVRFVDPPYASNGVPAIETTTVPVTICEVLKDSEKFSSRMTLRANLAVLRKDTQWNGNISTAQVHVTSIRESLSRGSDSRFRLVGKKERIELGLIVSYAYLYLCETAWWPTGNVQPNLWFAHKAAAKGLSTRHPFVKMPVDDTECTTVYSVERFMNEERPSLPALGKLLLEIWKGDAVEWKDLDATIDECNRDCIGAYWMCAVNACLGDDLTLKEAGSLRSSLRLRAVYVHKVIKSLQWLLEKLCRLRVEKLMESMESELSTYIVPPHEFVEGKVSGAKGIGNENMHAPTLSSEAARMPLNSGPQRLINVESLRLEQFSTITVPAYAILSHRWSADEVLFSDWHCSKKESKTGWAKIKGACRKAQQDRIPYLWVDTCCIDKSSSSELNEALNSMFAYYRNARVCYVYLFDVPDSCVLRDKDYPFGTGSLLHRTFTAMQGSQWFTRGWTLQELLAPSKVLFFSAGWEKLGQLDEMAKIISIITRIDISALDHSKAISAYSYAQRLSWAARRQTTRQEDEAYCLLGILDTSLEIKYGVGLGAFYELQRKLLESGTGDDSLFAWTPRHHLSKNRFFATCPADFEEAGDIVCLRPSPMASHYYFRSDGIGARVGLCEWEEPLQGWTVMIVLLNCVRLSNQDQLLALCLQAIPELHNHARSDLDGSGQISVRSLRRVVSVDRRYMASATLQNVTFAIRAMDS